MRQLHDLTQVLVASWVLSGDAHEPLEMPTSHGVLDRALERAITQGAFPGWASQLLHFVDSRVGLRCVELPAVLDWAQTARLTSAPNPSYRYARIRVGPWAARRMLNKLGLAENEARAWGEILRESLKAVQAEAAGAEIEATTD